MRIIRQIIEKKFTNFLEDLSNKKNNYWNFFQIINLINAIEGNEIEPETKSFLNRCWRNSIININKEKNLLRMEIFSNKNMSLVSSFMRKTEYIEKKELRYVGMYEKGKGIIGILGFEFQE